MREQRRVSREQRHADGKSARGQAPLASHAELDVAPDRDPVGLLLGQAESRVPELVPIRHARMLASPFAFYRGAALPMAADLDRTPTSGLRVQLCGDAHLANFGVFAAPDRRLVFDINDFDETLPGPFEWDVKRLAASFAIAGRAGGQTAAERRQVAVAAVEGYRTAMREFAAMPLIDVWYARIDVDEMMGRFAHAMTAEGRKRTEKAFAKARSRDSMQAIGKLTTLVDGRRRIVSDPPMVVPAEELGVEDVDGLYAWFEELVADYGRSLQSDRRHLLEQFDLAHVARKVVGVGSVGTRAWILLFDAGDDQEPLFLQAKEAQASVLAAYCGASEYDNQGQRVVAGQHLCQAASDIFLGWQRTAARDGVQRDFYVRQLRDWKSSVPVELLPPADQALYARLCGWTLARAHARSGNRIAIAAYLGKSDAFARAVADFAEGYADLTERDHAALAAAVVDGRAEAAEL